MRVPWPPRLNLGAFLHHVGICFPLGFAPQHPFTPFGSSLLAEDLFPELQSFLGARDLLRKSIHKLDGGDVRL